MAKHRGAEEQRREVDGWRASGKSAARFAAGRGYCVATLLRWSRRVPREVCLAAAAVGPRFVRLEVAGVESTRPEPELVVEVGSARVVVRRGFDGEHLRAVVEALATVGAK